MKKVPSPNFNERPNGAKIEHLVLHYTDMKTVDEAIARLTDSKAEVSSHYVIGEDGKIYQLVEEEKRAWHAGVSYWRGKKGLNDTSIGIEISNPGHQNGLKPFPKAQMDSVLKLSKEIVERYSIKPENIVAHSDIAPPRKRDPGEMFDWKILANEGVGLWYDLPSDFEKYEIFKIGDKGNDVRILQENLSKFGYQITISGNFDQDTKFVVEAFQRHFLPQNQQGTKVIDGIWTNAEEKILTELFDLI